MWGGNVNLSPCVTDAISKSIPCNGDTVINVKDYDKDAIVVTGVKIIAPAVSGYTWEVT